MSNYNFNDNSVVFLVNGADKKTSYIIIAILLLILVVTLIGFFLLMSEFNSKRKVLIISSVSVLFISIFLIFGLFRLSRKGIFARYKVTLNKDNVFVYDKRSNQEILKTSFDENKLYIAKTRQQVGYVNKELAALCYGEIEQIYVEDGKPNKKLIFLCSGPKKQIEELKTKILSKINP